MKKTKLLIFTLFPLLLSSCSFFKPFTLITSDSSNSVTSDDSNTTSSDDSSSTGPETSGDGGDGDEPIFTVELTNDDSIINSSKVYTTGNYSNIYSSDGNNILNKDGIQFELYRGVQSSTEFITLMPSTSDSDANGCDGALYNITPIKLKTIELTYTTSSSDSKVYYGDKTSTDKYAIIEASSNQITESFKLDNSLYFRITSGSEGLTIYSLTINYSKVTSSYTAETQTSYRIEYAKYSGDLVSGSSQVTVPIGDVVDGEFVKINEKTLTYYDQTTVISNSIQPSVCSYTDPFDVAAYILAFGVAPVNYYSDDTSVKTYFGNYARKQSYYDYNSGYVNAIDGVDGSSGYTEYDIYYPGKSIRGVGRVVVFNSGPYSNASLAVYTDDHYATFQEFSGFGFNYRFDAQTRRTGYAWSGATLLDN